MAAANGNGDLIVFPRTYDTAFLMCHCCGNHLITFANVLFQNPDFQTLVCRDPVNVTLGYRLRAVRLYNMMFKVRDVSCKLCGLSLGEYFVGNPEHLPGEQIYGHQIPPDTYQFALYQLLYWIGNHVAYASTGQV